MSKRPREDDVVESAEASGDASPPLAAPHLEWATFIKKHHQRIRDLARNVYANDAQKAWEHVLRDREALDRYSESMHHLATKYWDQDANNLKEEETVSGKYRYDDRIQYALSCAQEYFFGPCAGSNHEKPVYLPMAVCIALKPVRREHFQTHQRSMTDEDMQSWIRTTFFADENVIGSSRTLMRYGVSSGAGGNSSNVAVTVNWLDVGGCYGPFVGKSLHLPQQIADGQVTSSLISIDTVTVDLAPYRDSGVFQCDWLAVPVLTKQNTDDRQRRPSHSALSVKNVTIPNVDGLYACCECVGVEQESFDVVTFSLVLSYMPTPAMRYAACRKAHRVLRMDGLLIITSTRTQGPRQAAWVDAWIAAVESIGFQRVHKHIRCRLVGLTFRKITSSANDIPTDAPVWQSMTITADTL